ncbi:MAG: radical SAM (seleno)protein TrsS [Bacteroidales bacterium]
MDDCRVLYKTWSICPVCMKRLPAERVQIGAEVFLRKTCKEHGTFKSIIWRGLSDINKWVDGSDSLALDDPLCPDGCGLCSDHLQKTCCVLLNVTSRCNLNCRFCFADKGGSQDEPSFEEIRESLFNLTEKGKTLVQISGGEPTMRDDLPEIIKAAKKADSKYVQLNTNGIRLGENKKYVRKLAEAGLSFVFMQFDGTDDTIYKNLRGRPLLKIKQKTIKNCSEYNIGVILVPTIVRGINTQNIGEILRFAISNVPEVRGVHFQPVTFIGRVRDNPSDSDRITLDELISEIQRQTDGIIKEENLLPSACDHPLCGFHGDFIVDQNNVTPLLRRENIEKGNCCNPATADKNREFVARRWQRPPVNQEVADSCCGDVRDMESFLKNIKTNGFTVTAMAFQDAGNVDFSRLRNCSLHVYDKGRFIPFCSYYLSEWKQ